MTAWNNLTRAQMEAQLLRQAQTIGAMRAALRKLAIVQTHRMAYGGGTVRTGTTCKCCDTDWPNGQPESHRASCVLAQQPTGGSQ